MRFSWHQIVKELPEGIKNLPKRRKMSSLSTKPYEIHAIVYLIHEYLSFDDTRKTQAVSHLWHATANDDRIWCNADLRKVFPKISFIDQYVWEKHFNCFKFNLQFELTNEPTLKKATIKILKEFSGFKLDSDDGCTVLTIPKGLSLSILKTLARSNKPDCDIDTSSASTYVGRYGDTSVDKTYQIVITNSILRESRRKDEVQKSLENRLKKNLEIPCGLEAATLCLLTYQCFSKCLLKEKDRFKTYALCIQSPSDKRPCYVGNFQYDDGTRMHEDGPWYDAWDHCYTYFQMLDKATWIKDVGIIAMKRISPEPA